MAESRFRFVAIGPWAGMTEEQIERETLGLLDSLDGPDPDDDTLRSSDSEPRSPDPPSCC